MSLLYNAIKPVARAFGRGQLEEGMKDPAAFMEKVKALQEKPLPLDKLHRTYDFDSQTAEGTTYYRIHSQKSVGHRVILYFFGGSYCYPGNPGDFEFGEEMADETGADVWLVWYALFPDATGMDIARSAVCVYQEALKDYDAKDVSFYGNSAGASLCFTACVYLKKYLPEVPLPGLIAAHSPAMRIPPDGKEQKWMDALDHSDVIIPAGYMKMFDERSDLFKTGGFEEFGSPVENDWHGFPRTLALFGIDEVFLGYLPGIRERCRRDGVELETFIGKGYHCFSLRGILPEAHPGRERIYAFLRGERHPEDAISEELRKDLNQNQQGELNAVIMYRMLADRMDSEKDAAAMRRLAADELRHARIFRSITKDIRRPDRTQGDLMCLLHRILGKDRLFRLMAQGEYSAAKRYTALTIVYPQLESVMNDETRHGDALMGLLHH